MTGLLRPLLTRGGSGPERVANGVWRVQANPARMNVYLLEDRGELVMFDAGGRCMLDELTSAIEQVGLPLREVVLGHGHTDHRGCAPYLDVPVRCHPDEVTDASGSGGYRYWKFDLLPHGQRELHRDVLHPRFWDGGPVPIDGTISEGDEVCGFEVVHLPGHAPGLIALVRPEDGVALTTDLFYTIDDHAKDAPARTPMAAYNLDTEQARESLRKLAARDDVSVCWPGHGEPLLGDVPSELAAASQR